jgi:uncharacterized protein
MGSSGVLEGVLLAALLLALAWVSLRDRREYATFKAATDTRIRQRYFVRWTIFSFLFFCGSSVVILALLGRLDALLVQPTEFSALARAVEPGDELESMRSGLLLGMLPGLALGGIALAVLSRRGRQPAVVGDISALLPRNRAEVLRVLPLALNAGLSEELCFRLVLPLLLTGALGDPRLAFGVAALVFGLAHLYQGWAGVLATTAIGVLMTALYLGSGSLWLPIAVHALLDCIGLVIRPSIGLARASRSRLTSPATPADRQPQLDPHK